MNKQVFQVGITLVAIAFVIIFLIVVIPPFLENPDIRHAFAEGFVNPYSSGYSADVIACWVILLIWVIYESPRVKYGWICLILGIIPGVVVGFALYLLMRTRQLKSE
ncbi:MAG: DUF2834 domain-containing protein [Bacteroidota bacterium]